MDVLKSETCELPHRSRNKTWSAFQKLPICSLWKIFKSLYLLEITAMLNFMVIIFLLCFKILAPIYASLDSAVYFVFCKPNINKWYIVLMYFLCCAFWFICLYDLSELMHIVLFILISIFYKYSILSSIVAYSYIHVHTFYKYSDFPLVLAIKSMLLLKLFCLYPGACVAWFLWYVYHLGVKLLNHSVYLFLVLADTALYCYQILSFLRFLFLPIWCIYTCRYL